MVQSNLRERQGLLLLATSRLISNLAVVRGFCLEENRMMTESKERRLLEIGLLTTYHNSTMTEGIGIDQVR